MTASHTALVTVVRPAGGPAAALVGRLLSLNNVSVDLVEGWEWAAPGAVIALVAVPADAVDTVPGADHGWLVERRPQWDGAEIRTGRPIPGVKQVTFLRRAASIDHAQFAEHWSDEHARLARRHHPALWRYRQNVVVDILLPGTPDDVDGIAELGMRLRLDFRERMYDSEEGRRVVAADVRRFLDLRRSWQLMTREYPV